MFQVVKQVVVGTVDHHADAAYTPTEAALLIVARDVEARDVDPDGTTYRFPDSDNEREMVIRVEATPYPGNTIDGSNGKTTPKKVPRHGR